MPPHTDNAEPSAEETKPKTPEEIAALKKARIEYLEDIFLNIGKRFSPTGGALLKLTPREENELFEERPHLRPSVKLGVEADEPQPESDDKEQLRQVMYDKRGKLKNVRNMQMLAKRLCVHFEGRTCLKITPTHISEWGKPDKRKDAPAPPKPDGNEHKTQEWADWYERWMLRHYPAKTGAQSTDGLFEPSAKVRTENANARIAEMSAIKLERMVSERWMETAVVDGMFSGFAHWIGLHQDKFVEDKPGVRRIVQETLAALNPNLAPEFLTAFDQQLAGKLAEANSAMKLATAHRAKELIAELVEKRQKDIKEVGE